jgi:hypothetical protein
MAERIQVVTRTNPSTSGETKRNLMLALVFVIGFAGALPFLVSLFRLLDVGGNWLQGAQLYDTALRASLAIAFAGIILCVLILFYRLRNDDSSPSLTSGLALVALGAAMTVATALSARGQVAPQATIRTSPTAVAPPADSSRHPGALMSP